MPLNNKSIIKGTYFKHFIHFKSKLSQLLDNFLIKNLLLIQSSPYTIRAIVL